MEKEAHALIASRLLDDQIEKSFSDERLYRHITLANVLEMPPFSPTLNDCMPTIRVFGRCLYLMRRRRRAPVVVMFALDRLQTRKNAKDLPTSSNTCSSWVK